MRIPGLFSFGLTLMSIDPQWTKRQATPDRCHLELAVYVLERLRDFKLELLREFRPSGSDACRRIALSKTSPSAKET